MLASWTRILSGVVTLALLAPSTAGAAPAPGSYDYTVLPVPGLAEARAVAFHPDGSYAVVLEQNNRVQIIDWASRTAETHDLTPIAGDVFWEDLLFDSGGGFALLVGYHTDTVTEGVVFRLDDALYRSGGSTAQVFSEFSAMRETGRFTAIEMPWSEGPMVVLSRNGAGTIVQLRDVDPVGEDFGPFQTATASTAGCDDLAFANNEFDGFGILIVCGASGADALFFTDVGGVGEWRTDLGNNAAGNTSVAAAQLGGDYALVVSWSGRRLLRFEDGLLSDTGSSPNFPTQGIFHVAFAPDGERALVVGRAGGVPLSAAVLEYRHDLFSPSEITDVSIPNFDDPPFLGTSNTWLYASAWRPGCDGGLLVGGETDPGGSTGLLVEFALAGGASCDAATAVPLLPRASLLALLALASLLVALRSTRG